MSLLISRHFKLNPDKIAHSLIFNTFTNKIKWLKSFTSDDIHKNNQQ